MKPSWLPAVTNRELVEHKTAEVIEWVAKAGGPARFAFEEFLHGQIRNPFTRKVYLRAISSFVRWCELHHLDLIRVTPADVARHLDDLPLAPPTRKLHLSALRRFFDQLVLRHVILLNPALSVRGERYQVVEGRTPEITVEQARMLLRSIDASHVVGLRDRAIIGILIYTAVRVGAVAKLKGGDLLDRGGQRCLRFMEKGGKVREIPVRHDLESILAEYLAAMDSCQRQPLSPMFSTAIRRTKRVTTNGMTADDIRRMLKRRLRDAGLPLCLSPHSFRAMAVTDLLSQGVSLADVQNLAGHADPRTTRLYDRRQRQVTRNIVERISV
jgi:site-specific recombinase XerD